MKIFRRLFLLPIILFLTITSFTAQSQNITGRWQGLFRESEEYLQVNIKQNGKELCGFTYDYLTNNRDSYCIAHCVGYYDKGVVTLRGTGFISSSGNHLLMTFSFIDVKLVNGTLTMRGRVSLRRNNYGDDLTDIKNEIITLRRVSTKPQNVPGTTKPCFTGRASDQISNQPETRPEEPKPAPPKPQPQKLEPTKPQPKKPEPKKPEPKPVKPPAVVKEPEPKAIETVIVPLPDRIQQRSQVEFKRLKVNVKDIELKLYDNGEVDGDIVSVFYNGKLLVDKQTLSTTALKINLRLDENVKVHTITLFAENLGSIPPNTALIVVTAGKKRYELRSSADLSKNAVLVFEYEP